MAEIRTQTAQTLQAPLAPPFWTRMLSRRMQLALDLAVLSVAFLAAYELRFDFAIPPQHFRRAMTQLPWVVALQLGALAAAGVYAFIWRYVGMGELRAFLAAAMLWSIPLLLLRFGLPEGVRIGRVPLSVIAMDAVLGFSGVLGLRVLRRAVYERFEKHRQSGNSAAGGRKRVLLVGAGRMGLLAAREIQSRGDLDLEICGFVDDDPQKRDSVLQGIRVLGATADIADLVRRHAVREVVLTIAQASRREMRRIVGLCESVPVPVRIVPALHEILGGRVEVSRLRGVQIEDLLGRQPVRLDQGQLEGFLAGRPVLVTGAGGSIGSELAQQVARFRPSSLLLLERSEFALFQVDREIRANWPDLAVVPLLADAGDEERIRPLFAAHRPEVVLHAAAHKHVPMLEAHPVEAVKNNILATRLLGKLAAEAGAGTFVLVSTDKAVRPSSVMGASKRVAELLVQDLAGRSATRFVAVRFGNVIGSTGSVIPIFREQILAGGPLTVTHPEMVRYFMTIPEAAQLVLQAAAMGQGGELFVLDMGEPVRILDLARDMISLYGLKPHEDIDIVFTGIRPGEKLHEELQDTPEALHPTAHPKILSGRIPSLPEEVLAQAVKQLAILAQYGQPQEIRRFLADLLPDAQLDLRGQA